VAKDALSLDLADFDAVGIASTVVDIVRREAIMRSIDVAATASAPEGWHRVVITGRQSGHVVLSIRYTSLTTSRRHNLDEALAKRGWDLDEDNEGATYRIPPGTEPAIAAFELLSVLTLAGAPVDVRQVTAADATGAPVPLH
jgi:hypothetical protein